MGENVGDRVRDRLSKLDDEPADRIERLVRAQRNDDRVEARYQIVAALSNAGRLRMLSLLVKCECCTCELRAALDLPQSTVSTHLSQLFDAGLVHRRREGRWRYYRATEGVEKLFAALDTVCGGE
ncbi:MAG: metalloregulator ArsR/SmtB family transcription factor [Natronomonas sp.]|uniref:ArsR/SmtB family transcription factor n=1 Tax=Natronomonas sp. TaxID=2184060 RepID=UPI00287085D1|nr:metalloregulator ArsR/SmtB family transcription factor [Natronomonas sp.]MDR9429774.1 metalloregulator ArsR/SmtB family transcription factor [Natronomonas sp.]